MHIAILIHTMVFAIFFTSSLVQFFIHTCKHLFTMLEKCDRRPSHVPWSKKDKTLSAQGFRPDIKNCVDS